MADKKPGGRRGTNPVKPPTIDLKAEKVGEKASAAGAADAGKAGKPETAAKTQTAAKPAAAQTGKQDGASAGATHKPAQERGTPAAASVAPEAGNAGKYAGYAGAGALGGVLALAVGYGVSLFGSAQPGATVPPELTARLDAIEQRLGEAAGQDDSAALDTLRAALEDAQAAAAMDREALRQELAGLDSAAADLKTRLDAMAASGVDGAPAEAIAGIEAAIASLKDEVTALKASEPDGSEARFESLEGKVSALEADVAAAGEAAASLEQRLGVLAERVASAASGAGGAGGMQAAQALALADLRDAVSRGSPFTEELDALRALTPDAAVLEGLDAMAASGVATRRGLEADFSRTLPDVLSAAHKREDAGIFARLFDNARAIVTVRPLGAIDGDSPEAVVARIETKLADGDLAGALADFQALPQPARDAAGSWSAKLADKVRTDSAIDEFGRSVISGLKSAS